MALEIALFYYCCRILTMALFCKRCTFKVNSALIKIALLKLEFHAAHRFLLDFLMRNITVFHCFAFRLLHGRAESVFPIDTF